MAIERNFHKYLYELVTSRLSHNKLAKLIAVNFQKLNFSNKEKFFESILPLYNSFSDSQLTNVKFKATSKLDLENFPKDYRLKAIRLSNVRGITEAKNNINYGVDFEENGVIQNAVFLGPNGTGKSSLFCALEFIYTNSIGEKNLRSVSKENNKEEDYFDYLECFKNLPECIIETEAGNYSLRKKIFSSVEELKSIFPENHFICDYDLYRKGQLNYLSGSEDTFSLHRLIASSLGLQDYLDFTALLKSLSVYRRLKESNERKKYADEKKGHEEIISQNKKSADLKVKAIEQLKNGVQSIETNHVKDSILSLLAKLKLNKINFNFSSNEFTEDYKSLKNSYEKFIGLSVNPDLQAEAQFLTLGLELINHSENCPFCENSKSSLSDIKKTVEARVTKIKEYQDSFVDLEKRMESFFKYLTLVRNSLTSLVNSLEFEIKEIKPFADLSRLYEIEGELISFANIYTSQLNDFVKKISDELQFNAPLAKIVTSLLEWDEQRIVSTIVLQNFDKDVNRFLVNRAKIIEEIESNFTNTKGEISPQQQIAILESELKTLEANSNISKQRVAQLEIDINKITIVLDNTNKIKEEATEFAKILEATVNELVLSTFDTIKEPITAILKEYMNEDGVDLQIYLKEEPNVADPDIVNKKIVAEINKVNKNTGEIFSISPNKYFNTFRYRLFCMMVGLSIVITTRQNTKVNLPLVLDDIFYASDYVSKSTFKKFLINLLTIFKKYNGDMPLQFILFTHDELVFDCALDAVVEFDQENDNTNESAHGWQTPLKSKTFFARLFSSKDIDEPPTKSKFGEFWDLSYKIPNAIQMQLINEN